MSIKGYQLAFHTPEVRPVEIFLSKLPKAFDGFRILQISDLHVGPMIQKDYVEKVVEISSKHTVDLIALTGDFVDGSVESLREHVAPLEKLSAPMGKYFITGNHEYYSGVTQWIDEFKKLGAKVLLNEHVILEKDGEKIVLGGVTDLRGKMFNPSHISDPVKTFNNAPSNLLKILLAHQPKSIYAASEAGTDLQLSGHTHGGQYLPFSFLIYLFQPYVEGLNLHNKKTWIYVNQGTGFWGPPNRLGRKSEISLITLRTKA